MFTKRTTRKPVWPDQPCHRAIVAVDTAKSTSRTDTAKARLRRALYDMFENALRAADIESDFHDPLLDRGDGILALIHPIVPKTVLLNTVIPVLGQQLTKRHGLRLRAVVHAGEVLYDRWGCFGESLDLSFRYLDAPALKRLLERASAPLILVISEEIYQTVVRHGYHGIDDNAFAPLIQTQIAGQPYRGWVQVSHGIVPIANQRTAGAHA